jgi:nucleotide-binding universal stress UspA family protein
MYRRILVALDGSAEAERVLPHVEALAGKFECDVLLLRAVTPPERILATAMDPSASGGFVDPEPLLEAEEAEQEDAEAYLKSMASRLGGQGLKVSVEAPEADAADVIVARARDQGVDLIAMTTHGRTGLRHLLFGSVAEAVLRHAPCPVLLVRVRDEE